jgi:hypothetical protein
MGRNTQASAANAFTHAIHRSIISKILSNVLLLALMLIHFCYTVNAFLNVLDMLMLLIIAIFLALAENLS